MSEENALPSGWVKTSLDSFCQINMGQSPKGTDVNLDGNGLPFFQGKAEFGKIHPTPKKYCPVPKKIAEKNDILLSIRAPVGPTNICLEKSCIGRGLAAIRGHSELNQQFILYSFKNIEPWLSQQGTGSTFRAISGGFLRDVEFSLPPLNEQKRIADKLDSLLAKVDAVNARLDSIPTLLKRFRQSVLAAATSGELTKEWRRNIDLTNTFKNLAITDYEGQMLNNLPSEWVYLAFSEAAEIKSNLVDPKLYPDSVHIAPNYLEPNTGKILKKVTIKEDDVKSAKHQFYSGQIIYSKIRPYLNKLCTVNFDGLCSADMYPIESKINKNYLKNYMLSEEFVSFTSHKQSRVVLPKINQKSLNKIPVPVPPLEEQAEIVRRVEALFALADHVEQQYTAAKARTDKLTQALLAKAFRGELVPQDPTDEPASELLARIQAERDALAKAEKQRKAAARAAKKNIKGNKAKE